VKICYNVKVYNKFYDIFKLKMKIKSINKRNEKKVQILGKIEKSINEAFYYIFDLMQKFC